MSASEEEINFAFLSVFLIFDIVYDLGFPLGRG
jgi:hypothetical protein